MNKSQILDFIAFYKMSHLLRIRGCTYNTVIPACSQEFVIPASTISHETKEMKHEFI